MKKILITTLCIPLFSYAQQEKTFEIGAHLNFHSNNHSGFMQYGNREKQSILFTDGGLSLQYYLKNNFSLVGEINYKTLDTDYVNTYHSPVNSRDGKETFTSSIIEIPLMARFHHRLGKFKLFANIGPTLNIHVKSPKSTFSYDAFTTITPPFETIPGKLVKENLSDQFSTFYIGFTTGIGAGYHFNSKWFLNFEYRIGKSFANNSENKNGIYDEQVQIKDFKYNANQFTFGVGYKL